MTTEAIPTDTTASWQQSVSHWLELAAGAALGKAAELLRSRPADIAGCEQRLADLFALVGGTVTELEADYEKVLTRLAGEKFQNDDVRRVVTNALPAILDRIEELQVEAASSPGDPAIRIKTLLISTPYGDPPMMVRERGLVFRVVKMMHRRHALYGIDMLKLPDGRDAVVLGPMTVLERKWLLRSEIIAATEAERERLREAAEEERKREAEQFEKERGVEERRRFANDPFHALSKFRELEKQVANLKAGQAANG